ncbi:MAG: hypothetical protein C5B50_15015 [Verrucomicrobia bacterium]|nr:MAG: hypothetical protein C5B50_15015 [Verrucomicrobiota bacterium]
MNVLSPRWQAGVARRPINPPPGVELAGLGYYLNRTWERVRDNLNATALVLTDHLDNSIALVALDLMYNDAAFTLKIRALVSAQTDILPEAICVNCSHTHNAPTAGFIRGCGEQNQPYLDFAARTAAEAVVEAWRKRQPARLLSGQAELKDMTFNRADANGPVDTRVNILRVDTLAGRPLAVAVNFHSHCTAHMEIDLQAVSRDWTGEVVDQLEGALPGLTAIYLQGTCGDVNFRREFNNTDRRFEPARAITKSSLSAFESAQPLAETGLASTALRIQLPTCPWTQQEIKTEREEGLYRLNSGDTKGWMEGLGRACVNLPHRLPLRYGGSVEKTVAALARFAVAWTDDALLKLESGPETLETEVQAIRIGDAWLVAHGAELFTSLGLSLRSRWKSQNLFMLGFSNASIGYLPDAAEIQRRGYAAIQSPKCTGQFPFTADSGSAMVNGLLEALDRVRNHTS